MADTPKKPMTRAEYDAQVMRLSLEALERSYRLLKDTAALLTAEPQRAAEPLSDHDLNEIANSWLKAKTRVS